MPACGVRVEGNLRNEKINKVREHSLAKVPVLLMLGRREGDKRRVSMRRLGSQAQTGMGLADEATAPDVKRGRGGEGAWRRRRVAAE